MKLSQAIQYATEHQEFLDFLHKHHIELDSAHQIHAKISVITDDYIEQNIYFDYGAQGQSSSDVRVIVRYSFQSQAFSFEQIDLPLPQQ